MIRQLALAVIFFAAACTHLIPEPASPAPANPSSTPIRPPASAAPVPSAVPRDTSPPLPPIPLVERPLVVHVVYPAEGAPMANRDSNSMLGSLGNGRATLTINGLPATVYPNGAFMAFIPNPPAAAPTFNLVAAVGVDPCG